MDDEFDMFDSPKCSETSSKKRVMKKGKANPEELKDCLVRRLKSKPQEMGRYQQNSEKESEDYLFEEFLQNVNK